MTTENHNRRVIAMAYYLSTILNEHNGTPLVLDILNEVIAKYPSLRKLKDYYADTSYAGNELPAYEEMVRLIPVNCEPSRLAWRYIGAIIVFTDLPFRYLPPEIIKILENAEDYGGQGKLELLPHSVAVLGGHM